MPRFEALEWTDFKNLISVLLFSVFPSDLSLFPIRRTNQDDHRRTGGQIYKDEQTTRGICGTPARCHSEVASSAGSGTGQGKFADEYLTFLGTFAVAAPLSRNQWTATPAQTTFLAWSSQFKWYTIWKCADFGFLANLVVF